MTEPSFLVKTFQELHIPFDKKFFNLPFEHYKILTEEIGVSKVAKHMRTILMTYRNDKVLAEKARKIIRQLDKIMLEDIDKGDPECECGFVILEEYPECPCCGKAFYTGDKCYYKEDDECCSIDGGDCSWLNTKECGKLDNDGIGTSEGSNQEDEEQGNPS